MAILAALAAFAAGQSHAFKGLDVLQMPAGKIEAIMHNESLSTCADHLRRIVREYPNKCLPNTIIVHLWFSSTALAAFLSSSLLSGPTASWSAFSSASIESSSLVMGRLVEEHLVEEDATDGGCEG
eukprot:3412630-Pleurochrysis_carterae.AAC.1